MRRGLMIVCLNSLVLFSVGCSYDTLNQSCLVGRKSCDESKSVLMVCRDGEMVSKQNCALTPGMVCGENADGYAACVIAPPSGDCVDGSPDMCKDDRLFFCKNHQWRLKQDCVDQELSCMFDSSSKKYTCDTCTPGTYQCAGDKIQGCSNGKFVDLKTCADHLTCVADSDVAKEPACACLETSGYCSGNTEYVCNVSTGQYESKACASETPNCVLISEASVSCEAGECRPGTTQCEGDVLKTCSETGKWVETDCWASGKLCKTLSNVSSCEPADCTDGQYQCNDHLTGYRECVHGRYDGQFEECGFSQTCREGAAEPCAPKKCDAGTFECNMSDNALYECQNEELVLKKMCDSNAVCDETNGQCSSTPCIDGMLYKDRKSNPDMCYVLHQCSEDGQRCPSCEEGETRCDGNNLHTCQKDGTSRFKPCGKCDKDASGKFNCVE